MAKFCKNCGTKLEEGSVFCNECGTKSGESGPSTNRNYNNSANGPFSEYKIDRFLVKRLLGVLRFMSDVYIFR